MYLGKVSNQLKAVDAAGGDLNDIVEILEDLVQRATFRG